MKGRVIHSREAVEECWTLVGARRGRVWLARRMAYCTGGPVSVEFDGLAALRREERRGDVVGFLHTHPAGPLRPSRRDLRTMRAWCSALGKPLICLIARGSRVQGFRFDHDDVDDDNEPGPASLAIVQWFPRDAIVAVDERNGGDDGRQAVARRAVSRGRRAGAGA